jgi:aminobenzoyl-glutamate utilization protein B
LRKYLTRCIALVLATTGLFWETSAALDLPPLKQKAASRLDAKASEFGRIADAIWSYAELGFQETRSSKLLADTLERNGFLVERGVARIPTAFVASFGKGRPVIGVSCEFDALPGLSQKAGLAQKEPLIEGAPGHGDSHQLLGTAGVLTAVVLKELIEEKRLKGTIKLFGCPAEESGAAKAFMVKEGLMDGLDVYLDNHPANKFAIQLGVTTNALFYARARFFGKSAHAGSEPWAGVSALDALMVATYGMELLREHLELSHRIHYVITEGGQAPNVVPDRATLEFYVRDADERVEKTYQRVLNCIQAGALAAGCTYEVELLQALHQIHPNEALGRLMFENMQLLGAPAWSDSEQGFAKELQKAWGVKELGLPDSPELLLAPQVFTGGASSDVGDVSLVAPVATVAIPAWPKGIPPHTWPVTALGTTSLAHKAMLEATKVLVFTGLDVLTEPERLGQILSEFETLRRDFAYKSLLPENTKPSLDLYREPMERFRPLMEPFYMAPSAKKRTIGAFGVGIGR